VFVEYKIGVVGYVAEETFKEEEKCVLLNVCFSLINSKKKSDALFATKICDHKVFSFKNDF
jgi:hypothetical protein